MFLLNKTDILSNFFLGFGRKQRSDKGKKRAGYIKMSKKTKEANAKYLYKNMFGGDDVVNQMVKEGANKKQAKAYVMDVARQYDKDLNEGKDTNIGLAKVNKKYKNLFPNK